MHYSTNWRIDKVKKIHDLFKTMAEYENIGMIDFDINYKGGKRILIDNIDNFLALSADKDIQIKERKHCEYPYEAEFYKEGIKFLVVLTQEEKERLQRAINEKQANEFIESLRDL